jgi:L-serine dehydratase
MRAALRFALELDARGLLSNVRRVRVELYGSLALTGIGHATDRAVLLGLMGDAPDKIDPTTIDAKLEHMRSTGELSLLSAMPISFSLPEDLIFRKQQMYPEAGVVTHPNGMRFTALDEASEILLECVFYSIGGGFIVSAKEFATATNESGGRVVPYPFSSGATLLATAAQHGLTIAELVMANEVALLDTPGINRPPAEGTGEDRVRGGILGLWRVMMDCAARGIATEGILPGGLNVRRRAHRLATRLTDAPVPDPLAAIDWVTLWAMAVNEENAAGGRVVTAPTNGAAGVIPAIAHYLRFVAEAKEDALIRFFLTAAAIGILYKENASISGAEVGCQGEVGVACSMAAGGLVAALGGTNEQVEHAAEIGMEHNLGMTCDPIGGLVQIPCIERNGMGAVKAINAARMAMHETEGHKLSLDQVIETMYQTGMDMQSRYKETSLAGLALNIIEC